MSSGNPFSKDPSAPDKGNGNAEGGVPAAESLEEQVGALTTKLDEVETEKRELQERLLRGAAELDNYKKRMRREQTDAARYAAEPLIRDLLSVVDNLELAVSHAGNDRGSALLEGVTLVLRSFEDILKRQGVKVIDAAPGEPFDPNLHEAVDRREVDGPANRVVELWQRGYQLHDRLLRPARVVVSASRASSAVANGIDDD